MPQIHSAGAAGQQLPRRVGNIPGKHTKMLVPRSHFGHAVNCTGILQIGLVKIDRGLCGHVEISSIQTNV